MKFLKIKFAVIAIIMFAASSAFAALSYDVSVDTTILNGQNGYLYLQYTGLNDVNSTATVANFSGGTLNAQSTNVVDGSAVIGTLPGPVVFTNTYATNDYNHGITFGNKIDFSLLFASNNFGAPAGGSSTFSLGLFSDELGTVSMLGSTGSAFTFDLNNDGTTAFMAVETQASATPTPIPAAAYLLGSGLMGLVGIRRRKK